ncbi:ABC transporter permease subunit [Mesorhizobium sp. M1340]|uniref:ABC transporter permease subunit n=1 Tax=unclassified Mesorhizobium TaxID=325217 RepID=UPI003337EC5A
MFIGLGFNESAYLAEIFRAGFRAIDRGQTEAAQAIDMSQAKIWTRILIPQAMRTIIPPTGNETIGMLKMTSLVLAMPFALDLMFATNHGVAWTSASPRVRSVSQSVRPDRENPHCCVA